MYAKYEITKIGKYYNVKLINPPYKDHSMVAEVIETAMGFLLIKYRHELILDILVNQSVDVDLKRRFGIYGENNKLIEV